MKRWKLVRDVILFFGGLAGVAVITYTWATKGTEPNLALLGFFATMMGLPAFLQKDEANPPPGPPPVGADRRDQEGG